MKRPGVPDEKRRSRPTTPEGDALRLEILAWIREFKASHGYMPTLSESARAFSRDRKAMLHHWQKMREAGQVTYEDGNESRTLRLRRQR